MATPTSNQYAPRRSAASPSSSAQPDLVIGKFKRKEHIGKGSFAEVYRGVHIVRPLLYLEPNVCMLTWRFAGETGLGRHQVGQHEQAEQEAQRQPHLRNHNTTKPPPSAHRLAHRLPGGTIANAHHHGVL